MSAKKGVKYSSLESEVLLTELYCKLNDFPDQEKTKVVTSWLANSYADLTNTVSANSELLSRYIVNIKLFNTLVNNSGFDKACELAEHFSRDFLYAFVLPSLTETYRSETQLVEATFYFQVACENVFQPLLVRKIVELVTSHLLPTFIIRLKGDSGGVLVGTLSVFKVLLEYYCEDLWYELLLQYLLPMKHLLVSERQKAIPEISIKDSTLKFLQLIPGCITETVSPEILAEHFMLYTHQELNRLEDIYSAVSRGVPLPKSKIIGIHSFDDDDNDVSRETTPSTRTNVELPNNDETAEEVEDKRNSAFPLWSFKYDGTDVLQASRKYSLGEPEEYFEDDLFEFMDPLGVSRKRSIVDTEFDKESKKNLKLELDAHKSVDSNDNSILNTKRLSSDSIDSPAQENAVMDNISSTTRAAYLGPFLDSLFKLLNEWTRMEPEVTVMVSEIFSVLASSRIPLITSLILDMSITLQPCYPSFLAIVYNIRMRLDGAMQKYPTWFVKRIWQRANAGANGMLNLSESEARIDREPGDEETSLGDSIRNKVVNSSPFSLLAKLSKRSSVTALAKLFAQQSSLNENRILNRRASGFDTDEQEEMAKKMTLRCILFTHWLLELAAISQQICWSQSRGTSRSFE